MKDPYDLHELIERVTEELLDDRPLGAILHLMDDYGLDVDDVEQAFEVDRA